MKARTPSDSDLPPPGTGRRFVGIHFVCCNVYVRVYLNRAGTAFAGHCPRCTRPVRIPVEEWSPDKKFWQAG
ncbi:MAG: hypothetical protein HYV27_14055 [Candidatus Hydrogenedentes bacterium]|nr:hypothetical protein [Candidatus Hydrogenedentota bacterium]